VPARRLLAGAFLPLLGLLFLSGCSDQYPPDLAYGLRTDRIVKGGAINEVEPVRIDPPGEFPHLIDVFTTEYQEKTQKKESPTINPNDLQGALRSELDEALRQHFGTPAAPIVKVKLPKDADEDREIVQKLKEQTDYVEKKLRLEPAYLAEGSRLYRRHCLHCHGLTGNGQGPTGPWVNPHPRDYRLGKFKFTSSAQDRGNRKPRREDLLRTLHQGVEGTSMPSFNLLSQEELNRLVSYVTHLSMRGQVEADMLRDRLLGSEAIKPREVPGAVDETLLDICQQWIDAEDAVMQPIDPKFPRDLHVLEPGGDGTDLFKNQQKSVQNGQYLFRTTYGCIKCHTEYGRMQNLFWDEWGTVVRPANLTAGVYRGGRRPVDLLWRLDGGIGGTAMPAFNPALTKKYDLEQKQKAKPLTDKQKADLKSATEEATKVERDLWDIVNFLQVLPYKAMRDKYEVVIDVESE
jgi:mono/diheme cytochrome c family protein